MQLSKLYQKYSIIPLLQQHMMRVASVATLILDNLKTPLTQTERELVVKTCLLHDMGNIIKFKLDEFASDIPNGVLNFWQEKQAEYKVKYGDTAHKATLAILTEIGVSDRVKQITDSISFDLAEKNTLSHDLPLKICAYSDLRVLPGGVGTLTERLSDLEIRYSDKYPDMRQKVRRKKFDGFAKILESQVLTQTTIDASMINNNSIEPTMKIFDDEDYAI